MTSSEYKSQMLRCLEDYSVGQYMMFHNYIKKIATSTTATYRYNTTIATATIRFIVTVAIVVYIRFVPVVYRMLTKYGFKTKKWRCLFLLKMDCHKVFFRIFAESGNRV